MKIKSGLIAIIAAASFIPMASGVAIASGGANAGGVNAGGGTTTGGGTATGGGGGTTTGGGGGGGGGGGKAVCAPITAFTSVATIRPGAMGITSSYAIAPCTPRNRVTITATNVATGLLEFQSPVDFPGTSISFDSPGFATAYRVDLVVRGFSSGAVLDQRSIVVTTPAAPPNCATIVNYNLSTGYWINWAAIWTAYTVQDCGYGRQSVDVRVTNLDSGQVEYENPNFPMSTVFDYEGAVTSYSTTYQIDVEVRGAVGELLDARSSTIITPPMR